MTSLNFATECPPMSFKGNLSVKWKRWYEQFNICLVATDLISESDYRKNALLLKCMGNEAYTIYKSFELDLSKTKFDDLVARFSKYFAPKTNLTVERIKLFNRKQQIGESLETFLTDLKNKSLTCEFGALQNSIVKDLFIGGLNDDNLHIKEKLLLEDLKELDAVFEYAQKIFLSQNRSKQLVPEVNIITTRSRSHRHYRSPTPVKSYHRQSSSTSHRYPSPNRSRHQSPNNHQRSHHSSYSGSRNVSPASRNTGHRRPSRSPSRSRSPSPWRTSTARSQPVGNNCSACGQTYHKYKCPAIGVICNTCGKPNHFSKFCRKAKQLNNIEISNPEFSDSDYDDHGLFINNINCDSSQSSVMSDKWYVKVKIDQQTIKFLVDTGAQTNVMSSKTFKSLNLDKSIIKPSPSKVKTLTGQSVPSLGECYIYCLFNNSYYNLKFHILNLDCEALIGFQTAKKFKLLNIINTLNTSDVPEIPENKYIKGFSHLFKGIGCLVDFELDLEVDPSVRPKCDPPRKVPIILMDELKAHLDDLCVKDIIQKVDYYTPWVNSMVIVLKKDESIRICLDPRTLNTAIRRPTHSLPDINYIRSRLANSKYYTRLDLTAGFWNLKLTKASADLCTFNTPFGRYQFKRLAFGINAGSEIFQSVMVQKFGDIEGLIIFIDDFCVHAKTKEEHDRILLKVLKRADELGIKFHLKKCIFFKTLITFVGEIFSENKIQIDPDRIEAIVKLEPPTNIKSLQRFLGMINYLASFIPNLALRTENLRQLLKKQNLWQWSEAHNKEFEDLKSAIVNAPVLANYDVNKPIILSVDASRDALGAVILQNKRPIAYGSTTLTKSQQIWGQIEKELLAIYFGCKKFDQFCFGQKVNAESDHKPLETLFKKSFHDIPIRLQRIMLKLERYDLSVKWVPGKQLLIADALSRAPLKGVPPDSLELETDLDCQIAILTNHIDLSMTKEKKEELILATSKDETLTLLKKYYYEGWPPKNKCHMSTKPYYKFQDQIHVCNDLVFKLNSVIVPKAMRPLILSKIHEGHLGYKSCLLRAKPLVFWPFMNSDIKNMCSTCETCIKFSKNNSKEPLQPHSISKIPFEKIDVDLFEFKKQKFLLVIDYFSKYPEVVCLNNSTSAKFIIYHLKSIFARHGIPLTLISDNGPPFDSAEFREFLSSWGIEHDPSSPRYPRSNGQIERTVQTIKNLMKKCHDSGQDFFTALLNYRNTPKPDAPSPSQLLMSRTLRTNLPIPKENLNPSLCNNNEYIETLLKRQASMKNYHDRNARKLKDLEAGDQIYFKKDPSDPWFPGTIIEKCKQPNSYLIKTPEGTIFRRNRFHIKLVPRKRSPLRSCLKNVTNKKSTPKNVTFDAVDSQSNSNDDCCKGVKFSINPSPANTQNLNDSNLSSPTSSSNLSSPTMVSNSSNSTFSYHSLNSSDNISVNDSNDNDEAFAPINLNDAFQDLLIESGNNVRIRKPPNRFSPSDFK